MMTDERLEVISKPSETDHEAREMYKSFEQMGVSFVAYKESSLILQPTDGAFNFPAMAISTKCTAILARSFSPTVAMRCNLFNPATLQRIAKPVRISRFVIKQPTRTLLRHTNINQRLDRVDLRILSRRGERRDRNPLSVCQQHDFCSLAFFGLTHLKTPFFAGEKVPSPIACDQSSSFRRSMM